MIVIAYRPPNDSFSKQAQEIAFRAGYTWPFSVVEYRSINKATLLIYPEDMTLSRCTVSNIGIAVKWAHTITALQQMLVLNSSKSEPFKAALTYKQFAEVHEGRPSLEQMKKGVPNMYINEDTTMPKFTIEDIKFINGNPAKDMEDPQLFGMLADAVAEADRLENSVPEDVAPKKLKQRVLEIKGFARDLSKYIDSR